MAAIGLGLALAVSVIAVPTGNAAKVQVSKSGGEATMLISDPMAQYCPSDDGGNGSLHTFRMVYEPLLEQTAGGKLVPYLATSVTSTDNRVWTIKLRTGIKFHDGTDFNADAVYMNMMVQRNLGALLGLKIAANLKGGFSGNVLDVSKVDATTVRVTLFKAQRDWPESLYASGRNSMLAPSQLKGTTCSTVPVGTGPFKISGASTTAQTVFVKNENYWRKDAAGEQLPYLNKITVKYVVESSQRSVAVRANKSTATGFSSSVGSKQVAAIQKNGKLRVLKTPAEYFTTLWLNSSIAPFNNKNCRIAAAYAADPVKTAKIGTRGLDTPLTGLFAKGSKMYVKSPYSFNLVQARKFFGLCKSELKETSVKVEIPAGVDSASKDYVQLSANQLKAAGFDATVAQMLTAVQIKRAFSDNNLQVNTLQVMEGLNTSYWNTTFLKSSTAATGSPLKASLDKAVPSVPALGGLGLGTGYSIAIWPLLNLTKHKIAAIDTAFFDAQGAANDATMKAKLREGVKIVQDEALAIGNSALTYYYVTSPNIKGIEDYRLLTGARPQLVSNWGFMWTTAYLSK